ncbi:replication-relaxation family protein [Streptomyces roseoverticillatus]|uniref:replication-relaxation family protein n=1 Tax=Streptomyces roseoverticillatus TaxID=66429 RepID=UPI001F41F725|nr:replication-relaxation family protein [Streptomyces roseoverticillatus]MCF3106977.1 replication-relaxation family protein [Streptomyces roseoverticillatus]
MTTAPIPPAMPAASDAAAAASPVGGPAASPAPSPAASGRRPAVVADHAPCPPAQAGCNSSSPAPGVPGEASRPRASSGSPAKAGAEIRGDVLLTLAQVRLATPHQLKALLLPHHQDTDYIRRALRNLRADALVGRTHRAQQSYWYCTPAGLAEAAGSGELAPKAGWTTGQRAAAKTGLREHALVLVDTVIAFHHAGAADQADWQVEVAHPTPAGSLVSDGVALLTGGSHAFVEIDRTMPYARLLAKLERYDAYRNAPASGRGNAARAPRSHWQETYSGPSLERSFPLLLFVFAPAQRRAAPATREAAFHDRAESDWRITVATTTLPLLTVHGPGRPAWRVVGHGENCRPLAALPQPR